MLYTTKMEWLNYHHLFYFWMAVREGGIQPAARALRLTHPTVSAQIKQLEESLGQPLFDRTGRRLKLTEMGKTAHQYAEEIFSLGQEFLDVAKGRSVSRNPSFVVGITDVMPKLVVRELLEPALQLEEPVRLVCQHDRHDRLIAELALHNVDVVLADAPVPPSSGIRAFNHQLGRCGLTFFATPSLKKTLSGRFPQCLHGQPFLSPVGTTTLGRNLRLWFDEQGLSPQVVAEFEDSALMKAFGEDGIGIFCTPSIIKKSVKKQYGVVVVGETSTPEEHFYAISMERRVRNAAVEAVCRSAREHLFDTK